jgi:hypothetical protein
MTCLIPANQPLYDILERRLKLIKNQIAYKIRAIELYNSKQDPDIFTHNNIKQYQKCIFNDTLKCNNIEQDLIAIAQCLIPITTTDRSIKKYHSDFPNFLTDFIPQGISPLSMLEIRLHIPFPQQPTIHYTKENPRRSPRLVSKIKC